MTRVIGSWEAAGVREEYESAIAAAVLHAEGVRFVVVGSTALWLLGEAIAVHDLDVVVEPSGRNLDGVVGALGVMGARRGEVPPRWALDTADVVSVTTGYGRVDLLVGQGRASFAALADRAVSVDVCGVGLMVADPADAWALRARYKELAALQ
jgi:hypothetical protein